MKKIMITFSTLLLVLALASCGRGHMPMGMAGEGLTISAQGEAKSAPDQIQVTFSLGSLKPTAEEALSALESKHKSVIALLSDSGLETEDLKMTGYNLVTERRWDEPTRTQVVTGFRSNKDFSLDLDFTEEMVSKVYDTFSKVPSDDSTFFSFNVNFGLKDLSALEQEALATAIAKAKVDAEFIAQSAGVKLKGIMSITPDQAIARPVMYAKEMRASPMMADSAMGGSAPVNADDIKVNRNVTIVWRLFAR